MKVDLTLFHPQIASAVAKDEDKFDIRIFNTFLSKNRKKVIQYSGRMQDDGTLDPCLERYDSKILIVSSGTYDAVIIGPFSNIPRNRFTFPGYPGKPDQILLDVTEIAQYTKGAFRVFSLREGTLTGSQVKQALDYIEELKNG